MNELSQKFAVSHPHDGGGKIYFCLDAEVVPTNALNWFTVVNIFSRP